MKFPSVRADSMGLSIRPESLNGFFLTLTLLFASSGAYSEVELPPGCDIVFDDTEYPIIYTSQPRDTRPTNVEGQDHSVFQINSEVAFINKGFGESDLERKNPDGTVEVIYDCTGSAEVCAAQEPRISPDGETVAFSVSFGDFVNGQNLKINEILYAKLFLYDLATGEVTEIPHQDTATHNRMPDFLDNETIVYASNRGLLDRLTGEYVPVYPVKDQFNCHGGTYPNGTVRAYNNGKCVSQDYGYGQSSRSMQIWQMKIDGTGQWNMTPHEYNAIRPTVLRQPVNRGRIAYSSLQAGEDRVYHRGSPAPAAVKNLWWIVTMDGNGADTRSLIGAHHSGYIDKIPAYPGYQRVDEIMAVRSVAEDLFGWLYFTNYYRGNHGGLGTPYRTYVHDFSVEGCSRQTGCYLRTVTPSNSPGSGQYVPSHLFPVASFAVGSDNEQNIDPQGRAPGKLGQLFTMNNGHMGATWCEGWCYNQLSDTGYAPLTADKKVVELLVSRVTDPFDPEQVRVLVDDPGKHEMDAIQASPHPMPPRTPPLDPGKGCFLQVVDLRLAELHPLSPRFQWNQRASLVAVQAHTVKPHDASFYPGHVEGMLFKGVKLWDTNYPDPRFGERIDYTGFEDVWYLGTQLMEQDGSLKVQLPCDQPFQMSGITTEGKVIAHDSMLHSLRPGETRSCRGCHEGHSIERAAEYSESVEEDFAKTLAAATNPPLLDGRERVTFDEVAPVISRACGGCHSGFQNDQLLWSRVFADNEQLDFPWMKRMVNMNGTYVLPRPYFSGLTARYADWSPMYWYMVGRRTDGYANEDYPDDQDFAVNHPEVDISQSEISLFVKYLQLGAPRP